MSGLREPLSRSLHTCAAAGDPGRSAALPVCRMPTAFTVMDSPICHGQAPMGVGSWQMVWKRARV
jgi:hypothetical protein